MTRLSLRMLDGLLLLILRARLLLREDKTPADELSVDSLLPTHILVLLASSHTRCRELDVGRQDTDAPLLSQFLADVNGLLLQCCGKGDDDFSDGGGRGNGSVGDAAADQLGKSLDEL